MNLDMKSGKNIILRRGPENIAEEPKSKKGKLKALIILLLVLTVAGGLTAYYYYHKLSDLKADPQKVAEEAQRTLLERVGKLIVLPADEQPTIATVTDPALLSDQPFFTKAKIGDKVLIYTNARKAILYDPIGDKIVEVAPLTIGDTAGTTITDLDATLPTA